ncbi:MAG: hypothetical protein AAF518_25580, partial [Spirochaetota bacterium]
MYTAVKLISNEDTKLDDGKLIKQPVNENETKIDTNFKIANLSLACTAAGKFFFPPLSIFGVGCLIYLIFPIWKRAYYDLTKRKKITRMVVESIALPGTVLHGFYFAASLTYWFLYCALVLILRAKKNTINNIGQVFALSGEVKVWIVRENVEVCIQMRDLQKGDVVVLSAGEMIPINGKVVDGSAVVEKTILTRQSEVLNLNPGDLVCSSTMVILQGKVYIEVDKTGEEALVGKIHQFKGGMTDYTNSFQMKSVELADKFALPYLMFGGLATSLFGSIGGLAVLYFPIDDALYSAGPLAVLNYLNRGISNGIIIKDGQVVESFRRVNTIIFDSIDAFICEQPALSRIHQWSECTEIELLTYAAAAEQRQKDLYARAICEYAVSKGVVIPPLEESIYKIGLGMEVVIGEDRVLVGTKMLLEENGVEILPEATSMENQVTRNGDSIVYIAVNGMLEGGLEFSLNFREDIIDSINAFK